MVDHTIANVGAIPTTGLVVGDTYTLGDQTRFVVTSTNPNILGRERTPTIEVTNNNIFNEQVSGQYTDADGNAYPLESVLLNNNNELVFGGNAGDPTLDVDILTVGDVDARIPIVIDGLQVNLGVGSSVQNSSIVTTEELIRIRISEFFSGVSPYLSRTAVQQDASALAADEYWTGFNIRSELNADNIPVPNAYFFEADGSWRTTDDPNGLILGFQGG